MTIQVVHDRETTLADGRRGMIYRATAKSGSVTLIGRGTSISHALEHLAALFRSK